MKRAGIEEKEKDTKGRIEGEHRERRLEERDLMIRTRTAKKKNGDCRVSVIQRGGEYN